MIPPLPTLLLALAMVACENNPPVAGPPDPSDLDGDGWPKAQDCDDADPAIHPGAPEVCDDLDDDCDGLVDADDLDLEGGTTWHLDNDGDGWGGMILTVTACEAPTGYVEGGDDCDDTNADVHPSGTEYCNGLDDDCDGEADEDEAADAPTWHQDRDGDGYGDPATVQVSCTPPPGWVDNGGDCDDAHRTVSPAVPESCNDIDDDCDGTTDEFTAVDASTWYTDTDDDGFGVTGSSILACDQPTGTSSQGGDCDDGDDRVHPGAPEDCDGLDEDCDGVPDDGLPLLPTYDDADGDGFGTSTSATDRCDLPPGTAPVGGDCRDDDPDVHPGAAETCNGDDDDCDTLVDDDDPSLTGRADWYLDADGDAWGDPSRTFAACAWPAGAVPTAGDCDDTSAATHPEAMEICDGLDQDCDGTVDDGLPVAPWYRDADDDGWGVDPPTDACASPTGYVPAVGDCDDTRPDVFPGAPERCDGGASDEDCDDLFDEEDPDLVDAATWYPDRDRDRFGDPNSPTTACTQPAEHVADATDCDDGAIEVHPGAPETCGDDGDDDCDGLSDEGCVLEHCGPIVADETWAAAWEHLVTCDVLVEGPALPVLTVEDGAQVLFAEGVGLDIAVSGPGSLQVQGTTLGVTFGTDTLVPLPGHWLGLTIGAQDQGSRLEGLDLFGGGGNGLAGLNLLADIEVTRSAIHHNDAGGLLFEGSPTITDTTVYQNQGDGVASTTGALGGPFTGNVVRDNAGYPVSIPASTAGYLDASSSYADNLLDVVRLLGATVSTTQSWQPLDVPYQVAGSVTVEGPAHPGLTLEDGVTLQFEPGTSLEVGMTLPGSLTSAGATLGVLLTSAVASPAPGDWGGLQAGPLTSLLSLTSTLVEYGADPISGANLYVYSSPIAETVLAGSLFRAGGTAGASLDGWFSVTDSTFSNNGTDGVYLRGALAGSLFQRNTLTDNSGYPLAADPSAVQVVDPDNDFVGNGFDLVRLGSTTIRSDVRWPALSVAYYLPASLWVDGGTLTLADGLSIWLDGSLAVGFAESAALWVEPGPWGVEAWHPASHFGGSIAFGPYTDVSTVLDGLTLLNLQGLDLTGAALTVEGMTVEGASMGIRVRSGAVAIQDVRVTDSTWGIWVDPGATLTAFSANELSGNDAPLSLPPSAVAALDTTSTFTGNLRDAVLIQEGILTADATWEPLDVPYEINGILQVEGISAPVLALAAGTRVELGGGAGIRVGETAPGGLVAEGTSTDPVILTALAITAPWNGIYYGSACTVPASVLEYALIELGGASGEGLVGFDRCTGAVRHSTLRASASWGIWSTGASPDLADNLYADNAWGDVGP